MGRDHRRAGIRSRKRELAVAACGLALAGTLSAAGSGAAQAANNDRIDVGITMNQGGIWKGSGSFSNVGGTYTSVCVALWDDSNVFVLKKVSQRCVNTGRGDAGYAFSAPNVKCSDWATFFNGDVYTTVTGYSGANPVIEKFSNHIAEWPC